MGKRELVDVVVQFLRETDAAILVTDGTEDKDRNEKRIWLPKSQIEYELYELDDRNLATVTLPEWLAKEKGLV